MGHSRTRSSQDGTETERQERHRCAQLSDGRGADVVAVLHDDGDLRLRGGGGTAARWTDKTDDCDDTGARHDRQRECNVNDQLDPTHHLHRTVKPRLHHTKGAPRRTH